MNAKKCDRCKEFFDSINNEYLELEIDQVIDSFHSLTIDVDLCPKCKKEFERFLGIDKEVIKNEKK